jgi:hypothetical protein
MIIYLLSIMLLLSITQLKKVKHIKYVKQDTDFSTLVLPASTVLETASAMSIFCVVTRRIHTFMILNFVDVHNQDEILSQILLSPDGTITLVRTNTRDCYQRFLEHLQYSEDGYNFNVNDDEFSTIFVKFDQGELVKAIELERQILGWENVDVTKLACFAFD